MRIAATAAIVAGLIIKLSPADLASTVRDANPWLMLAALGVAAVVQALVVMKWLVLLHARDVTAPLPQVVRAYCVGSLLSNVLPTAVGGDVYRVYHVQREAAGRTKDVTMSVLYERATGYGAMTCLAAAGAAFHYGSIGVGLLTLGGGALAGLGLAVILPRVPFPALRHDHPVRHLLAHRREAMAVYQMLAFSIIIQALHITTIMLAGQSFGVELSWWYWALITWIGAVAVLLPITLGGFGVRESSFSALVARGGAEAAQGASTGFALAVLLIVVNGAGLLLVEAGERLGYIARAPVDGVVVPTPVGERAGRA